MENSILDIKPSPMYGFSKNIANTNELNSINTYDRSLEKTVLDQYELEAGIAKKQPDVEEHNHNWLSDAYGTFLNKKNEIQLMSERAKIVNEIDPKLDEVTKELTFLSEDDPDRKNLSDKQNKLLEDKQSSLDTIHELENKIDNRNKEKGVSAHFQAEEILDQDKSLRDLDYWAYAVPGTMGSSFSDISTYLSSAAAMGIQLAGSALAGSATVASGGALLPFIVAGVANTAAAGVQLYGINHSNRSESLAETYGAYKDKIDDTLQKKGTSLQEVAHQIRAKMPNEEANKFTDDQIADKIITGEININDDALNDIIESSKKGLDYVYDRNRALTVMDYVETALTIGTPFGIGSLSNLITKPIKGVAKVTKLGTKTLNKGQKVIDDIIGWNTKIAMKHPVLSGARKIPKNLAKYGISAIGEGFEEGSQNIFNRDFINGKYDEDSAGFLNAYSDFLNANYRVAKILSGIDTETELAKDPDFWNEVKGGVALGLFMGGAPVAANTVVGTAKDIAANQTVRDLTADNLDKKDLMNRISKYSEKATKRFGNYDDEIIKLLEGYKHTDLPDGVTEQDVDNEIKLAKSIQASTKNKYVNALAKAAGFNKGSREYNAFLGLRHLSKVDTQEATDNLNESIKNFDKLTNDFLTSDQFNSISEDKRELIKQKLLSESFINTMMDWIENMESKPQPGKKKFGILDGNTPVSKEFLKTLKENLLLENLKLKTLQKDLKDDKSTITTSMEPSKELLDSYVAFLLAKSDVKASSKNSSLLNSENAFRKMNAEDKEKTANEIKNKVNSYLQDVDNTENTFKESVKDENGNEVENKETESILPLNKPTVNTAVGPTSDNKTTETNTEQQTEETEQQAGPEQSETISPANDAETGQTDAGTTQPDISTEEQPEQNPDINTEVQPEPVVETEEQPEPEVETEEKTPVAEQLGSEKIQPTVKTVEEQSPDTTTEEQPIISTETEDGNGGEPSITIETIDEDIAGDPSYWDDLSALTPSTDPEATEDVKANTTKVNLATEKALSDTEGTNPRDPKKALAKRGEDTHDKISNVLFYGRSSSVPLLPGYEPGTELAKILDTPGIFSHFDMQFFIGENGYVEEGGKPYVKGDRSTWDSANIFLEIKYNGKKYLMTLKTPKSAMRINNDSTAIQKLIDNRNAIIEAIESLKEGEKVVPMRIISTSGLYNQNIKEENGFVKVVHRSVQDVKGLNIPEDPYDINENTVDIAIGKGILGNPPFSLFDANEQMRRGHGGSGQIFYMAKPSQTLNGQEIPIQLNLSKFNGKLVDFIYDLIVNYTEGSSDELKDVHGKLTSVKANEILETILRFGPETAFKDHGLSDEEDLSSFLKEKQLFYSNGMLFVGKKVYNPTKLTEQDKAEIKEHLKTLHWKVDKTTFWSNLRDVFPSVMHQFDQDSSINEVEVIPGYKFTREQFEKEIDGKEKGMTLMGWMISNNLLSCDLKDQLFTDAFNFWVGIGIQDSKGTVEKKATDIAVGTSTLNSVNPALKSEEKPDTKQPTSEKPVAPNTEETKSEDEFSEKEVNDFIKSLQANGGDIDLSEFSNNDAILPTEGMPRVAKLHKPIEKKVSKEEVQWFKAKLGLNADNLQFVDQAIALGNDVEAMGLCKLYSTVLWKGAEQGTLYHEAFHKVSLLLLSPNERQKIYKYYRNLNKSKVSDREIEELLAEDFRDYMLNKTEHKLNIVKRLFKMIKNFINKWFNRSEYNIHKLFDRINSGYYANAQMNPESVKKWLSEFKEDSGVPFVYKGIEFKNITNTQVEEVVKTLASYAIILNNVRYSGDVAKINFKSLKIRLHPQVSKFYVAKKAITKEQAEVRTEIYNNFDKVFAPLVEKEFDKFRITLNKTKEEIDEETEEKASGNETGDEMAKYTKQANEISSKMSALPAIKMLIACLPKQEFDPKDPNKLVTVLNRLTGIPLTVDFDKTWNRFSTEFANCNEFEDILDKAVMLGKQYPLFRTFANTLSGLTKITPDDTEETKIAKENLQTQVRNTFRKHIADYVFCLVKDVENADGSVSTEFIFNNENANKQVKNTLTGWTNNLLSGNKIISTTTGVFLVNKPLLNEIINTYRNIASNAATKLSADNLIKTKEWIVSVLDTLGIETDMQTLNHMLNKYYSRPSEVDSVKAFLNDNGNAGMYRFVTAKLKDVLKLEKDGTFKSGKFKMSLDRLYTSSEFLNKLSFEHNLSHPTSDELSILTTDDKIFYAITEKNYFFDFVDELNNDPEVLKRTINVMYNGGINKGKFIKGSRLLNALKKGRKLKSEVISGFKRDGSNDAGRAYKEISPLEDYVMKLALTRSGRLVLPTMGDSVSYNVLSGNAVTMFDNPLKIINGEVSFDNEILDTFANYFETELDTILFNYDHQPTKPNEIIKNYDTGKRWGYKFRYFSELTGIDYNEGIAKAEENDIKNGDKNYTLARAYVQKIKDEWAPKGEINKEHCRELINTYLINVSKEELKFADKLGLIKFDGENLNSIENISIPSSFIKAAKERYISKYPDSDETAGLADKYAAIDILFNYFANHAMSEIEFTKLFNKDPAYYKSQEDLLKRRREVFSTGITPREEYPNDPEMNDLKEFTVGVFNDHEIVSKQIDEIMKSASYSYAFDKLQREAGLNYDEAKKALDEKDPKYDRIFREAEDLANARFEGYRNVNQTDATVLISPEGYKQLVRRFDGWTPEVAKAFDILNNADILTSDNASLYHDSLNCILSPLKCMFFGGRFNDELRREVPIFNKMAMFPVFPVFSTGDMKYVLNRMTNPKDPIHMIAFESAVKVGQDTNANMYNKETDEVDVDAINNIVTHKQKLKYFRKQMVTNPHDAAHEQMFVSQAQKAALLNIRKSNRYITPSGDEMTGGELLTNLFKCMNVLTDRGASKIETKLGIHDDPLGKRIATPSAVSRSLYKSAEASKMNQNMMDGLEVVNGKPKAPLSALSDNAWIEAKLISDRNRDVIDVNTPGGMFIQMSSVAYNSLNIRTDKNVRRLKFDNADGSMECVVSINLLKTIIPDYDKKSFKESKDWLISHGVIGSDQKAMSIGYRIPAQGPSSVAALKVVDVYPENIGDTITLPDCWTALTGSDFDVDKLFVARYNYDENGKKIEFNPDDLNSNSDEALQNRMLDLYIASISNPMQYSESKQPLDAVTSYLTKKILADIDKLKGFKKGSHIQLYYAMPSYHNDSKANLMSGKMNLGAFALSNSHHMLSQAVNLAFKHKNRIATKFGLESLSKIHSDKPNYHNKEIKIFTLISDWLSAMVNAHVDVAKDAYINRLNVRKLTLNTVNLLLRGGKGESTFYFMSQDILVRFADEFDKYSGFYGVSLGSETPESKAYKTVVEYYLKKYNELKTKDMPAMDMSYTVDELTKKEIDQIFDIDYLRDTMPRKEDANWYYKQLKILQAYEELQPAAKELSKCVTLSQIDTKKFGNNFGLQQAFLLRLLKFYKEDKMFTDPVSVIRDTFLKEKLIKGLVEPRQNFGNLLLRVHPIFENLRNTIYKMLGNPEYLDNRTINNVTRMMESSYKLAFFNKYAQDNQINIYDLLYGANSIPRRLSILKNNIKSGVYPDLLNSDGTFSNSLLDNITPILRINKDDLRLPAFLAFKPNKDEDHNIDDHIIRAWEELLDSDYKEVKDFARDLVVYAMITSGDSFGKNNIFKYVPNSFRETSGYFDFVRQLSDHPETLTDYIDIEKIFKNLWWDDNIVKPIDYRITEYDSTGVGMLVARPTLATSNDPKDVILVEKNGRYTMEPLPVLIEVPEAREVFKLDEITPVFNPFIKINFGGRNNPLTTKLYKYSGYRVNDKGKMIPVYQITEKHGMNYKGKTLIDFNDSPITNTDALSEYAKNEYLGYTRVRGIIPKNNDEYNNYLEEIINYMNGIDERRDKPTRLISISKFDYDRSIVEENSDVLYIFTDNTDRTSDGDEYGDSWYKTKYGPGGYGSVSNPTSAVIRGLENAAPISTMKYFYRKHKGMNVNGARWTDADIEEFKKVIDDEIEDIKKLWDTGKYKYLVYPKGKDGFFNSRIANISQERVPQLYEYLKNKKVELENYIKGVTTVNPENNNTKQNQQETVPEITYDYSFTFKDGVEIPVPFKLNKQQEEALWALEEFYDSDATSFTLKGYAGTGKTTIMKIFDAWLKTRGVSPTYASPTHRANAVTKMNNPKVIAKTLHKLLGLKPSEDITTAEVDLNNLTFSAELNKEFNNTLFIVDECSMINDSVYDCLIGACQIRGENNKLIFLGDPKQLQPVKSKTLSKVFTDINIMKELTHVERTGDNGILAEATNLRNDNELTYETKLNSKGEGIEFLNDTKIALQRLKDIILSKEFMDDPLYFKLLTATNDIVSPFNNVIRSILYGDKYKGKIPTFVKGERLMAYDNTKKNYRNEEYPYDILNSVDYKIVSDPKTVTRVLPHSGGITVTGIYFEVINVFDPSRIISTFIINPNDKVLEEKIIQRIDAFKAEINAAKMSGDKQRLGRLYSMQTDFDNSFQTIKPIERITSYGKSYLKKEKTFDYGYVHTIHKSQGGTYENVMVIGSNIESGFANNPATKQQLKYVAVTRAKSKVLYITDKNQKVTVAPVAQVKDDTTNNTVLSAQEINELKEGGKINRDKCN